jgi:Peptidase family M28
MRSWILMTTVLSVLGLSSCLHRSPGTLHPSSTVELSVQQKVLRKELRLDVDALSTNIGPRNAGVSIQKIRATEQWIVDQLLAVGIESRLDEIPLGDVSVSNIEASFIGSKRPEEIIVLGAHYDTSRGSPGANDNASGVALLLATARRLHAAQPERTIRTVFFVNEENPFSFGIQMGSRVYAERCRARNENIVAMIAVDSVGYFSSVPRSQNYPWYITRFPSTGNFLAFSSNLENQQLVDNVVVLFQSQSNFPSIGVASESKELIRSDAAPFWWQDYPSIAMNDTSEYRDPNYHKPSDTAEKLNYDEMARMADGFLKMIHTMGLVETTLP